MLPYASGYCVEVSRTKIEIPNYKLLAELSDMRRVWVNDILISHLPHKINWDDSHLGVKYVFWCKLTGAEFDCLFWTDDLPNCFVIIPFEKRKRILGPFGQANSMAINYILQTSCGGVAAIRQGKRYGDRLSNADRQIEQGKPPFVSGGIFLSMV